MSLLDLAEAIKYRENNDPESMHFCDLLPYREVKIDALRYLAIQQYSNVIWGLEQLHQDQADILAQWDATLIFDNLKHLDLDVAEILVNNYGGQMIFKALQELSPALAKVFSRFKGCLWISTNSLSVEAAHELSNLYDELNLTLSSPLTYEALLALSAHTGLSGLRISCPSLLGIKPEPFEPLNKKRDIKIQLTICVRDISPSSIVANLS